ncbi:hypothetical protein LEMLEM_LOCUS3674 [Lemmus lemmus]
MKGGRWDKTRDKALALGMSSQVSAFKELPVQYQPAGCQEDPACAVPACRMPRRSCLCSTSLQDAKKILPVQYQPAGCQEDPACAVPACRMPRRSCLAPTLFLYDLYHGTYNFNISDDFASIKHHGG